MTIQERIKSIRLDAGLSQDEFSNSIDLKRGNYSQIELGKQNPTIDTIRTIARIYNKSYIWIIDGEEEITPSNQNASGVAVLNEPKIHFLPHVVTVKSNEQDAISIVPTKVAAGYLNGYSDPEFIENLPTIEAPGFRGGLHRAFEIRGNSMPPMHPGAISIGRFEESLTGIRNRRVYIVVTKNEGIVLKRVINNTEEEKLILISDNPNKREFPNYTVDYQDIIQLWYWRGAVIREIPDPSDMYNRMNDLESEVTILKENYRRLKSIQ